MNSWNKARVACLVQILQGLFLVRTVNLTQIAETFQTPATEASSYRRVQRFFKDFSFDMSFIVILVTKLFIMGEKCVLIIDRTNWKWGKTHINIFMVSIEHFGIGIPIFWTILDKGGTSSSQDRIDLLSKVIKRLGVENIKVILGDREFIGELWFRFLIENKISFVIRVKGGFLVGGIQSDSAIPIKTLVKKLGRKKKVINHPITLWGHCLFASVEHAKGAKEPLIVVSNEAFPNALDLYRWRWGIETLFSCLKTRGFRMEDTHMVEPAKIEKLIFVLAIGFCWAYKTGELLAQQKPIEVKKHNRKAKSIFRLGLNFIRSCLFKLEKWIDPYMSLWEYFNPMKSEPGSI
jgi:hypothetical protein